MARWRPGRIDSRERYSDRVMLLIASEDSNPMGTYRPVERFFVVEFNAQGAPVGKDEHPTLAIAIAGFNSLVEQIEREEHVTVRPI